MNSNKQPEGNGLISLTPGSDLGLIETWRPRKIAIAGVRFNTGGAAAAASIAGGGEGKAAEGDGGKKTDTGDGGKKTDEGAGKKADEGDGGKKADEGKKGGEGAAAEGDAAKNGKGKEGDEGQPKAPDKYELSVPDAAKRLIDDEDLKLLEQVARANGWTNEQAQAELDGQLERIAGRIEAQSKKWRDATEADADYGGDKMTETTTLARRAVDALRPKGHARRDSFIRLLNEGGYGNNLEVVSFLADLGKLLGEDSPGLGKNTAPKDEKKSDATVLFPSTAASA